MSRPRGHDYRPLHADKHPQGDQHGVFDLFPYRHAQRQAAKIEAERIHLKGQGGERDEGAQRQKLGEGGHQVNPRCRLDTAQDQKVDDPQQNRRANDRLPGITIAKQAQLRGIGEKTERRKDDNQIGDVGDHRAQPVSPGGAEADQFAESFASVGEDPAVEVGTNTGQQQHGESEKQDPDAGDGPANEQSGGAGHGSHILRQTEYASAEH